MHFDEWKKIDGQRIDARIYFSSKWLNSTHCEKGYQWYRAEWAGYQYARIKARLYFITHSHGIESIPSDSNNCQQISKQSSTIRKQKQNRILFMIEIHSSLFLCTQLQISTQLFLYLDIEYICQFRSIFGSFLDFSFCTFLLFSSGYHSPVHRYPCRPGSAVLPRSPA